MTSETGATSAGTRPLAGRGCGFGEGRWHYLSAKKLLNRALVEWEFRQRKAKLRGRPYMLVMDPTNICNLRCPLCPTGLHLPSRPKGYLRPDSFRRFLDPLAPFAFSIQLYNWGEPLLNPDLPHLVAYAEEQRVRTVLSSNLTILTSEQAEALVASGLHTLVISCDGATQETYQIYRRGGDFRAVMENIRLLQEAKAHLGSHRPRLQWQFLVFKHNCHEVAEARALAAQMGVEIYFQGAYLGGPGQTPPLRRDSALVDAWLSPDPQFRPFFDYFSPRPYLRDGPCFYLWRFAVVNWDGSVSPCCAVHEPSTDFGHLFEMDFEEIWNNPKFQLSRRLFNANATAPKEDTSTICAACLAFRKATTPRLARTRSDE